MYFSPADVLLGSTEYSTPIDMWGVGCIFYEMASGRPLFPGSTVEDELHLIFKVARNFFLSSSTGGGFLKIISVGIPTYVKTSFHADVSAIETSFHAGVGRNQSWELSVFLKFFNNKK